MYGIYKHRDMRDLVLKDKAYEDWWPENLHTFKAGVWDEAKDLDAKMMQ